MSQPIFVVRKFLLRISIHHARKRWTGLQFGGIAPDELLEQIDKMKEIDGHVHIAAIGQVIHDSRTNKLPARANSGLNYIKARINRFKVKQPIECPCCGAGGLEYRVGFCTREHKGVVEKLKMHYSSCSKCIDIMEDHAQRKKNLSVWNRFVERVDNESRTNLLRS